VYVCLSVMQGNKSMSCMCLSVRDAEQGVRQLFSLEYTSCFLWSASAVYFAFATQDLVLMGERGHMHTPNGSHVHPKGVTCTPQRSHIHTPKGSHTHPKGVTCTPQRGHIHTPKGSHAHPKGVTCTPQRIQMTVGRRVKRAYLPTTRFTSRFI